MPEPSNQPATPPFAASALFGVMLVNGDGSESGHSIRWQLWDEAAQFGEGEVKARRARGFRVFRDTATSNNILNEGGGDYERRK